MKKLVRKNQFQINHASHLKLYFILLNLGLISQNLSLMS